MSLEFGLAISFLILSVFFYAMYRANRFFNEFEKRVAQLADNLQRDMYDVHHDLDRIDHQLDLLLRDLKTTEAALGIDAPKFDSNVPQEFFYADHEEDVKI